jgi:ribosomal protein S18 acetylase RimI-like enzyme
VKIEEIEGIPDYAEIIDLINAEWPDQFGEKTEAEKIRHMQEHHNLETDTVKYLLDGEEVVGFYRYSSWPRDDPQSRTAHLLDIAVLPSHQGRGLGKRLMMDLIRDCGKKGTEKLLSRTFKTNLHSIRLHRCSGFTVYKTTDDSIVWQLMVGAGETG